MKKLINRIVSYKYIEYILLSLVIILGFVVRLYKINNPIADWHSWRQADTSAVSRLYAENGINLLYPKYEDISEIQTGMNNPQGYRFVEFPFYNALTVIVFKAVPKLTIEVAGRLISIVFSLGSVFFLYLIGKRYMGKWGGVLAAFFFAFIPYNIYYSRVILPEPMGVLFALAGIWFFIKYVDSNKVFNLFFTGILFALSFLIKPFTAFYGLPLIYILLEKYNFNFKQLFKEKKLIIFLIACLVIAFVPLLLWRFWMGKFPEGIPFYKWAFNGDGIRFRPAFWRWIFGERIGYLILGIWGLIPMVLGILQAKKGKFFNLFFFLGTLLYTMVIATANVRHDYYQIFLIPAMSLLLAEGTLFLWQNTVYNQIVCRSLAIFSVVMMLGMGTYQIKEYYKVNHPEIIEAGKALDKIAPKDALVLAPYNGDTAFLYQTKRSGWPGDDTTVNDIIQEGATFYVSVNFADKDTIDVMKRFTTVVRTDTYVIVNLLKPNSSLKTTTAK